MPDQAKASSFVIDQTASGGRLDVYLARQTGLTRSAIQKLIKDGSVKLNHKPAPKTGIMIEDQDLIEIIFPPPQPDEALPENIELDICYEDKDILVVNKPAGLVVHPAVGHARGTLVNALLYHCQDLSGIGGVLRPGIVHRLDKETSGLMVVAKNDRAHQALSRQFKAREVKKTYLAVVEGSPQPASGTITGLISRHARDRQKMAFRPLQKAPGKGKEATSSYITLAPGKKFSLVEIRPLTGRTHQIRVQLAALGCPLAGDKKYGGHDWPRPASEAQILPDRHFLHAWRLDFRHPVTKEILSLTIPPPEAFTNILKTLGIKSAVLE